MKTVIWVETLEGHYVEIGNGSKLYFEVETLDSSILGTRAYDIIQYDMTKKLLTSSDVHTIYESTDKKKSQFIYNFLWNKILEKKEILEERKSLKKIKGLEHMAEEREKKLRNELFVVKIEDILNQYDSNDNVIGETLNYTDVESLPNGTKIWIESEMPRRSVFIGIKENDDITNLAGERQYSVADVGTICMAKKWLR